MEEKELEILLDTQVYENLSSRDKRKQALKTVNELSKLDAAEISKHAEKILDWFKKIPKISLSQVYNLIYENVKNNSWGVTLYHQIPQLLYMRISFIMNPENRLFFEKEDYAANIGAPENIEYLCFPKSFESCFEINVESIMAVTEADGNLSLKITALPKRRGSSNNAMCEIVYEAAGKANPTAKITLISGDVPKNVLDDLEKKINFEYNELEGFFLKSLSDIMFKELTKELNLK